MDIENDLQYLAETDEIYADASAKLDFSKDMLKNYKGMAVVSSKSSVSKAQEEFYASQNYINSISIIFEKQNEVNKLRNKRATAILRIDVWRTLEASRRKGNI